MKTRNSEPIPNARIRARRAYSGPVFLSGAFRPFFLAASVWAIVAIAIWMSWFNGLIGKDYALGAHWHIHEMLFGFAAAAVAGFILTAVPNWTGRLPVRGWSLGALALLWLCGRMAMLVESVFGLSGIGWIDILFLAGLFLVVAREIIAGKNRRNLVVAGLIGLFALANLLTHLDTGSGKDLFGLGWRLGLAMLIMLLALIGGRITPSFTRNWLSRQGIAQLPAKPGWADKIALGVSFLALVGWTIWPMARISGLILMLAGLAQLYRLSRWSGMKTLGEPIVLVLHIGYGWIGIGLILMGGAILSHLIPASDAVHALTMGAASTMITAVASRASLGHSGRMIRAGKALSLTYILISVAALFRISYGLVRETSLLDVSGLLWCAGYGIFVAIFIPVWFGPRLSR